MPKSNGVALGLVRRRLRTSMWMRVSVLVVSLCVNVQAYCADVAVRASGISTTSLSGDGSQDVVVTLAQREFRRGRNEDHSLYWGGDDSSAPKTLLTALTVVVGKESVVIPHSAYSDLGDVGSVSLSRTDRGFKLEFHGGETASGYDAELVFEGSLLVERVVVLREFPKQRREETRYSYVTRTFE